jgi:hypothetical protein
MINYFIAKSRRVRSTPYTSRIENLLSSLVLVAGSYKMPVNKDLIDLAEAGDDKAILLMMKWGYEGSKTFIGGNPVKVFEPS